MQVASEEHWPNPLLSSAKAQVTPLSGATGVKMTGPYAWVPPSYWLLDAARPAAQVISLMSKC